MERPFGPEYFSQPLVIPASIVIFRQRRSGMIDFLYFSDCLSKISKQGMLTTRTFLSLNRSAVSIARDTSEPVAIKTRSGWSEQSLMM